MSETRKLRHLSADEKVRILEEAPSLYLRLGVRGLR